MPSQFVVIQREIPLRGACYLICGSFDPSDFSTVLAELTKAAFNEGAVSVSLCCRDGKAVLPKEGFDAEGFRFSPDGDYVLLYKNLTTASVPTVPPLSTKPLRPGNAILFRDLYNEAFFSLPGAKTLDEMETDAMLGDHALTCGFLMEGGLPVGVYELSHREEIPEIAAMAIVPSLQGKGYGRRTLSTLEHLLIKDGHSRVQLLTYSQNEAALRLYRRAGYGEDVLHSTWYRTNRKQPSF